MSEYIGTAMLISSTESPDAGRIGDLMITMPTWNGYEVHFVFMYQENEEDGPSIMQGQGRPGRSGNMVSFTCNDTGAEYVFEVIEWDDSSPAWRRPTGGLQSGADSSTGAGTSG